MVKTATFITRSGEKKNITIPEDRRTVVSSSGVQTKTVRIPVKGQKNPAIVSRKLVDTREFTDITGEPVEVVKAEVRVRRVGTPPSTDRTRLSRIRNQVVGPTTRTYSRTEQAVNARNLDLQRSGVRTPIEGYTEISEEERRFGKPLSASQQTTPGQSANEFRRLAYRLENPFESSNAGFSGPELRRFGGNVASFGVGVFAAGLETVQLGADFFQSPLSTSKLLATSTVRGVQSTFANPSKAYTSLRVKTSTPSGLGSFVAEQYLLGKGIKGARTVVGSTVSRGRYLASTYKIPIEELAEPEVVSGATRLNIGSVNPKDLQAKFFRESNIPGIDAGKTGSFATANRLADYDFVRDNRDLLATSVAPVTASSPQFAIPKSSKSTLSALFSGEDVPLLPGRKQSTIAFFETERGFQLLPGKGPLPFKKGKSIVESAQGQSVIYEAPKYASVRRGLGEQEGNIPAGALTQEIREGIFKSNLFQRIIGGGSAYTQYQGKPIRLRKFAVTTNALEVVPTSRVRRFTDRISRSYSNYAGSGSLTGFIGKNLFTTSLSSTSRSRGRSTLSSGFVGSSGLLSSSNASRGRSLSSGSLISNYSRSSTSVFSSIGSSKGFSSVSSGFSSFGSSYGSISRGSSLSRPGSSLTSIPTSTTTNLFKAVPDKKTRTKKQKSTVSQLFIPTTNLVGLTVGTGIKVRTGKELLPGLGLPRLKV